MLDSQADFRVIKEIIFMEKRICDFASSESVLDLKSYYSLIIKLC